MAQPSVSTTSMFHIDYVPEPDSPRTRILKGSLRAQIEAAGTLLDWQRRNIDDSKMEEISDALIQQVNPFLNVIDLRHNDISEVGCAMLARSLHQTRTLREFQLFGNRIGNLGAESLAAVMLKKRVGEKCFIRTLGLASNSIGDLGAIALASALQHNTLCSVTCLDLGCNQIGDDGAKAFAETLRTNEKLCELFLWHNEIKDEGALALSNVLAVNSTLNVLDLEYNPLSEAAQQRVRTDLQTRPPPQPKLGTRPSTSTSIKSVSHQLKESNNPDNHEHYKAPKSEQHVLLQGAQFRKEPES